jgi:hypothetical protein
MKVKELIKELENKDPEMEVFLYNQSDGAQGPLSRIEIKKEYWTVENIPKEVDPYDVVVFVSWQKILGINNG